MAGLEGWRKAVADQAAVAADGPSSLASRVADIRLVEPLRDLMMEAAMRRNITLAGYSRRAVLSWIAHDLGLDFYALIEQDATPSRYGEVYSRIAKEDETKEFGSWQI